MFGVMNKPDGDILPLLIDPDLDSDERARRLLPLLYQSLRALAQKQMSQERRDHTLSATALVHEVYLRLNGDRRLTWQSRAHFFSAAAEAMRQVLMDHARKRERAKRGGGRQRIDLDSSAEIPAAGDENGPDFIAIDEALCRLNDRDARAATVVRLRFYCGLTAAETAELLGASVKSVNNDWTYARAWLSRELKDFDTSPRGGGSEAHP